MENLFEGDGLIPIYRLQKVFFDEYGSPDKRVKKFENVTRFRVDVCELAKGADGNPLSSVCTIWVTVKTASEIAVHLSGSLPLDGAVKEWIGSNGKSIVKRQTGALTLSLNPGNQAKLAGLAKAMRTRAASREPYKAASHGNSALEIAQGLEHLQEVLNAAWKQATVSKPIRMKH